MKRTERHGILGKVRTAAHNCTKKRSEKNALSFKFHFLRKVNSTEQDLRLKYVSNGVVGRCQAKSVGSI